MSKRYMGCNLNNFGPKWHKKIRWKPDLECDTIGTLSNDDDDDGRENVAKKMNLRSFKLNRVYLDPLNLSNAGDFSWS